jgi:hypothetical protein
MLCLACVVLHASGSPNPNLGTSDLARCLSFAEAETLGLNITKLREDYTVAVEVFPDAKADLAEAWSELQYTLRDRLQENEHGDLSGRSMFSVVLFEPDGRIAWVFYRGLEPDEERVFCEVVKALSEGYRFPLHADTRFSQCGTTYFKENQE